VEFRFRFFIKHLLVGSRHRSFGAVIVRREPIVITRTACLFCLSATVVSRRMLSVRAASRHRESFRRVEASRDQSTSFRSLRRSMRPGRFSGQLDGGLKWNPRLDSDPNTVRPDAHSNGLSRRPDRWRKTACHRRRRWKRRPGHVARCRGPTRLGSRRSHVHDLCEDKPTTTTAAAAAPAAATAACLPPAHTHTHARARARVESSQFTLGMRGDLSVATDKKAASASSPAQYSLTPPDSGDERDSVTIPCRCVENLYGKSST
jgi:hypothetical protein